MILSGHDGSLGQRALPIMEASGLENWVCFWDFIFWQTGVKWLIDGWLTAVKNWVWSVGIGGFLATEAQRHRGCEQISVSRRGGEGRFGRGRGKELKV